MVSCLYSCPAEATRISLARNLWHRSQFIPASHDSTAVGHADSVLAGWQNPSGMVAQVDHLWVVVADYRLSLARLWVCRGVRFHMILGAEAEADNVANWIVMFALAGEDISWGSVLGH